MPVLSTLLSSLLLSQTTPSLAQPPPEPTATERAATSAERAAERAADAAERAAEANTRTAQALERLAQQLTQSPAVAPAPAPAPAATPAAPPPGQSKAEQEWNITMGLGLIFLTGNSSTVTLNGLLTAERQTEHWIYSVKAVSVYGESRAPAPAGQTTAESAVAALNAGIQVRGDRRFSDRISGYLLTGAETDHVKSVEFRGSGEAGVGIIWWDLKRPDGGESYLRTDLALHYGRERRFQYYPTPMDLPDVSLGGPRFGAVLRYAISSDVSFLEDLSVLPSLLEGSRLVINSQTQLTVRLTRTLGLATTFLVQSDSEPAAGKLPTDTSLSVSATVNF